MDLSRHAGMLLYTALGSATSSAKLRRSSPAWSDDEPFDMRGDYFRL
jgi:hypothetical protein